jgi:hypothetical protein
MQRDEGILQRWKESILMDLFKNGTTSETIPDFGCKNKIGLKKFRQK